MAAIGAVAAVLVVDEEVNAEGDSRDKLMTHRNLNAVGDLACQAPTGCRLFCDRNRGTGLPAYTVHLAGQLVYEDAVGLGPADGVYRDYIPTLEADRAGEFPAGTRRLVKSLYLLRFINDESYRRRILVQLNCGEGRHQLARIISHVKRGKLRQRCREGQQDQHGELGRVVNLVVLGNTICMDATLDRLRADRHDVRAEDVARLSPLGCKLINMLGRYAFTLLDIVALGELRPLRDPNAIGIDYA